MQRVFVLVILLKITGGPVVIRVGAVCITLHREAQGRWGRGERRRPPGETGDV